jgi:hypothetical protein
MTIKGINALCDCDTEEYSLFTGARKLQYPMKQYRVQVNGNAWVYNKQKILMFTIRISNITKINH